MVMFMRRRVNIILEHVYIEYGTVHDYDIVMYIILYLIYTCVDKHVCYKQTKCVHDAYT